ncbi:MAG: CBS domain-containing protein [Anaerolineaceae bacterium]|nr:CBS domain-containing protein [Anaerolineaceae bacterium]
MAHKVKDWMSSPVVVVDSDSTVSYALTLMRRRNIHSVVVNLSDQEEKYGIVTITDIRNRIIAKKRDPKETRIQEIMSYPLATAQEDWSLVECSSAMQENHINHLPVVDGNNNLVGIISTTDLFIAAEEAGWEETY